ncbi:hypothetical protein Tco_1446191 [Tanacetum coccineum]
MVKGVMIEVLTNIPKFSRLSDLDRLQLDKDASVEEIKNAVWDCRSSKAPGPNGFSFLFLKIYWDFLKDDVVEFVSSFLTSGQMSFGSNSAFITLIPKVHNPLIIKDYRPISLIGLQYKNRMAWHGPDRFLFLFLKMYWDFLKDDVVELRLKNGFKPPNSGKNRMANVLETA